MPIYSVQRVCRPSPYTSLFSKGFKYCSTMIILRVCFSRNGICNKLSRWEFLTYVLFSDEATFNRDGVLNRHLWPEENSHGIRHHTTQHLTCDCLVGSYLLPSLMTSVNIRSF
ncbi:hypothetical protein CEXT_204471 [Caerostris extrusa]|uniref:Uncharacterized protein n=1 Tax=Caerostris extrusa TaxID=172846 RepID=A0AAV4XR72_CAEEX|nr:hypothetical protein CEXT_204471 [Caerostris extrusa]